MTLNLDELLPELPSIARLLIARDLTGESEILAIDLDSKRQVGVDTLEAYNFIPDLIGLTPNCTASYNQGQTVAAGMAVETWALWLDGCEFAEAPGFVWLTCSKDGDNEDCISAVCLTDRREVIAPPAEKTYFIPDCIGWKSLTFNADRSIVVRMAADDWQSWLETYEVCELDDETAAPLSAI